jgi:nucleoside phosphorylase
MSAISAREVSDDSPKTCDFAIVTVVQEASLSVRRRLGLGVEILRDGHVYWWGRLPGRGGVGEHVVVCGWMLQRSNISASIFTRDMLQAWRPRCLIVADIGGGVKGRENLALGDVVIGEELHYYEFVKATKHGDELRNISRASPSMAFMEIARAVGVAPGAPWRAGLRKPERGQGAETLRLGEIAVGEKLLANPDDPRLEKLLDTYPKVLAVDMESVGVAHAVQSARSQGINTELLILRSISDFCNGSDNQDTRDRWKPHACEAAAAAARAVITSTPVEVRGTPALSTSVQRWRRRPAILGTWLLLLIAAAPFGYLLAELQSPHSFGARSALVALTFVEPWRRVQAADRSIAGLRISSPIALAHRDDTLLLAGRVLNAAAGPDPAPTALRARWIAPAMAEPVADAKGLLYRAAVRGGGSDRLVILATSAGWIAVACEGTNDAALASCEEMAATVRLLGSEWRSVGPNVVTARALNAVLVKVGAARNIARKGLSSNSTRLRASAASNLANVLTEVAGSIASLDAGPRDAAGLHAAWRALDSGAGALRDLAEAAQPPQALAYARAARRVQRSEADLVASLKRAGYLLPPS